MTPTCASSRGSLEKAKDCESSMGPIKPTWRNSVRAALMHEVLDVRFGQGADPYLKEAQGPRGAGAAANRQPVSAADIAARSGTALTSSAVLLALAVVTVLTLIVPARATHNERSL
ncbi:hypothetical protein [Streptomyces sp. 6-11-2]|uniref:hypothetical protein n=1 Tax=Streptomyces sp. 6-11-2 TaxID=2585753 RepID=UPI00114221C8|nr:hypothetical protein [Streptomyces sp. 6-11-2]GED89885.1 hypothetical protein TNCT6_69700 [Streptomyces sp. 6-11-2]